jgi:hypothetical protein
MVLPESEATGDARRCGVCRTAKLRGLGAVKWPWAVALSARQPKKRQGGIHSVQEERTAGE